MWMTRNQNEKKGNREETRQKIKTDCKQKKNFKKKNIKRIRYKYDF